MQGRDLYGASRDIDRVIAANRPAAAKAISVTLSGQVETMRESYSGLFSGIALAIVLVYLFLVINFQSWIDPLIVLMAIPFALSGVMWLLFLTQTHLSVPALMGTLMCIGLTTANSILVVELRQPAHGTRRQLGRGRGDAGYTRLRPVLIDRRRYDPRHGADGARRGGGRRAECTARARRHRRTVVRHLRDPDFRAHDVPPVATRVAGCPSADEMRSPMDKRLEDDTEERSRRTTYGDDVASTESHAVATGYDPRMSARLKRAGLIFGVVLLVGFLAVRVDRYFHDRGLRHTASEASSAAPLVDVISAQPVAGLQRFTLPGETAAWSRAPSTRALMVTWRSGRSTSAIT